MSIPLTLSGWLLLSKNNLNFERQIKKGERSTMKLLSLTGLVCFSALLPAQEIHYDYDRGANFSAYHTYQWVGGSNHTTNQLMDQNIRQSIDSQLALKGLQRVETGGDLHIAYQVALDHEKQFDGWGVGPRWMG